MESINRDRRATTTMKKKSASSLLDSYIHPMDSTITRAFSLFWLLYIFSTALIYARRIVKLQFSPSVILYFDDKKFNLMKR